MRPSSVELRAAMLAVILLCPAQGGGQSLGLFFDSSAQTCTSSVEPFGGSVRVYVIARPGSDHVMTGARFAMQQSARLEVVGDLMFGRHVIQRTGTLAEGVDIQFDRCFTGDAPVPVVEFDMGDFGSGHRDNLILQLVGSSQDTIQSLGPELKICDPSDFSGHLGFAPARSQDASFNCTIGDCTCGTTAIETGTWSMIKNLFSPGR